MPGQAHLEQMPAEVLHMILENLMVENEGEIDLGSDTSNSEALKNITALASLCRTCKSINVAATPALYRTFIKPETPRIKRHTNVALSPSPHLHRFLRTITAKPTLGELVEYVYIGPFENSTETRKQLAARKPITLDYELRERLFQAGKKYDLQELDADWLCDLYGKGPVASSPSEDAQVALLLCLLKNVSSLCLYLPDRVPKGLEFACFTMAFLRSRNPSMTRLKTLEINSLRGDRNRRKAPPVVVNIDPSNHEDPYYYYLRHLVDFGGSQGLLSNHIQVLELHDCSLQDSEMDLILQQCSNLESFVLGVSSKDYRYNVIAWDFNPLDWANILHGLSRSSSVGRLQHLNLHFGTVRSADEENCKYGLYPPSWTSQPSQTLPQFTALKELEIDEAGWFKLSGSFHQHLPDLEDALSIRDGLPGLLPPSLEDLLVVDCSLYTIRYLQVAVEYVKLVSPSLRHVSVELSRYHLRRKHVQIPEWDDESLRWGYLHGQSEVLREAMRERGISYLDDHEDLHPSRLEEYSQH